MISNGKQNGAPRGRRFFGMIIWMGKMERAGQIALPYVLIISGVMVEIALTGAAVVYFLSVNTSGERLSVRASAAAYSGLQDGMRKVSENKELGNVAYCLSVGEDKAKTGVQKAIDSGSGAYLYTIRSVSRVGTRYAQFSGTLAVNQTTGKVYLRSVLEEPVSMDYDCP